MSASLVLYKPNPLLLERTQYAALGVARQTMLLQLVFTLVEHSDDALLHSRLRDWFEDFHVAAPGMSLNLLRVSGNLGFGRGNNLVINRATAAYHLIINPNLFVT